MEKIRIPKTSNVHHSKEFKKINYLRNNLLHEESTSRTDDFLRKLNYSFDNYKITKNKIQLKSLDEKPLPVKPSSRPPVFERLTQGLLKYRVALNDLDLITANWKKRINDPDLDPCADIDHKAEGLLKYRVSNNDLNIVIANWKEIDPNLPGNCPRDE